jgi:hypothetical protein
MDHAAKIEKAILTVRLLLLDTIPPALTQPLV